MVPVEHVKRRLRKVRHTLLSQFVKAQPTKPGLVFMTSTG